ncbi:MAG: hypothetical protein AAF228_09315 [Pseudomonadota bacterium]
MKYSYVRYILAFSVLLFSILPTYAGTVKEEAIAEKKEKYASYKDAKGASCGQQEIHGFASQKYDNLKACGSDKKKLSISAVDDAKERCNTFCKNMECKPPKYPQGLKATAACKPIGKAAYGTAKTATAIICKCTP